MSLKQGADDRGGVRCSGKAQKKPLKGDGCRHTEMLDVERKEMDRLMLAKGYREGLGAAVWGWIQVQRAGFISRDGTWCRGR